MKKWIIKWDTGYGESAEVIEADTFGEAEELAYENWKEEAESSADFSAEEWTQEEADNYSLTD